MIITRSPLRISLGGGGTDLPSYYREHGGFLIAGAIDKYVYITLHETFVPEIIVRYSKMEVVSTAEEIKHPIVREALRLIPIENPHLELTSMSDIPAGTGLGSSGSFTTALLAALHAYAKNHISMRELAEQACHIEMDLLKEPIGKQDQYIAAYGGITAFTFHPDGHVDVQPDEIDRGGDDAQILGSVFRPFFAGLREIRIGVFSLEHHGQVAGIELARRELGCPDIRRRLDGGDAAHGVLCGADLDPGPSVGPDRLDRETVPERDVVPDLLHVRRG